METTNPTPASEAPTGTPPAEPASLWEDFIDIFYAPAQVFRRRAAEPVIWIPLAVLTVLIGVLVFAGAAVLEPMYDAEFERGMQETMRGNAQLSADELERMRGFARSTGLLFAPLGMAVGTLVLGLVVWAVARLFGAAPTVAAATMVAVFAQFPRIPQQLVAIFQGALMSPESLDSRFAISAGPARFFDDATTSELVMVLMERLDLFTLWVTLLIGIGFYVIGRLPRGQAAVAALMVWIVGSLPMVIAAAT